MTGSKYSLEILFFVWYVQIYIYNLYFKTNSLNTDYVTFVVVYCPMWAATKSRATECCTYCRCSSGCRVIRLGLFWRAFRRRGDWWNWLHGPVSQTRNIFWLIQLLCFSVRILCCVKLRDGCGVVLFLLFFLLLFFIIIIVDYNRV